MSKPIVFIDIAGPDDEALGKFYSTVFKWDLDENSKFAVPVGNPMGLVEMEGDQPRIPRDRE